MHHCRIVIRRSRMSWTSSITERPRDATNMRQVKCNRPLTRMNAVRSQGSAPAGKGGGLLGWVFVHSC